MSGSTRPNEQMSLSGFGVPTDPWTGEKLSPAQITRLIRLKEAEKEFRQVLHELDGTTLGSRPGDRRMALAFTKLEEAALWASTVILDQHGG